MEQLITRALYVICLLGVSVAYFLMAVVYAGIALRECCIWAWRRLWNSRKVC